MKNKLEELRKNILIEVYSWAGLSPIPGRTGFIITKDQFIYYYHEYQRIAPSFEGKVTKEGISDGEKLSKQKYQKVIKFIEEKILDKQFEYLKIFDASFHIEGNYHNQNFNIVNHTDLYEEINKIIRGGK